MDPKEIAAELHMLEDELETQATLEERHLLYMFLGGTPSLLILIAALWFQGTLWLLVALVVLVPFWQAIQWRGYIKRGERLREEILLLESQMKALPEEGSKGGEAS